MSNAVPPSGSGPPPTVTTSTVTTSTVTTSTVTTSTVTTSTTQTPIRVTAPTTGTLPTLAAGQSVAAQVLSSGNGQLLLQTANGQVAVQSPVSLPAGTQILLQAPDGQSGQQQLLLLAQGSAGQQTTPGPNPAAAGAPAAGASAPRADLSVTTRLIEGGVVRATVTGAPAGQDLAGVATAASRQTAAQPATTSAAPELGRGALLNLRVLGVSPPAGPLPKAGSSVGAPAGQILTATVTGQTPSGLTTAQIAGTEVTLAGSAPLPAGSRLSLELLGIQPASGAGSDRTLLFADRWETLRDTMAALQQGDPAAARADNLVPSAGPRLSAGMLFFLAAVLSGDLRRFIGEDALRFLTRNAPNLLDRLSNDLGQMQRFATEPSGQDWRTFLIPVFTQDDLEQIRFYLKDRGETADGGERDTGVRFMIEARMSRLGSFQFDGLAREKQVDVVVRTQSPLHRKMREDIRAIYVDTLTALDFSGTIGFRVTQEMESEAVEAAIGPRRDLTV